MLMIHTADLHLGASPDAGEPWGKNRKQEIWESFERLILTTEEQKADLLLIAGDLFHRPPLLRELREVNGLFERLSKTQVVLMAGNHDFAGGNSFYHKFRWAEHVSFLPTGEVSKVYIPHLHTEVYGFSYDCKEMRERDYDFVCPEDNDAFHILLAHGGDEKHQPFSKEKLGKNGFDYIALGHIHKPGVIIPEMAVMAGSLEPLDHTCLGKHGYVKVSVEKGKKEISFVPSALREYRTLELAITPEDTMASIFRQVEQSIHREGDMHIYEVVLKGKRHSSLEILEEKIKSAGNIWKITDATEKSFDYESLSRRYEGRLLQKYIASFDIVGSAVEKRALELGTEAILEAMGYDH